MEEQSVTKTVVMLLCKVYFNHMLKSQFYFDDNIVQCCNRNIYYCEFKPFPDLGTHYSP